MIQITYRGGFAVIYLGMAFWRIWNGDLLMLLTTTGLEKTD